MKIITKDGFLHIDPTEIIMSEYMKHSGRDEMHEIRLSTKDSHGMMNVFMMPDMESAFTALEEIETARVNARTKVLRGLPMTSISEATLETFEPEKTYMDGFKEGTEYALNILKENKGKL